MIRSPNILQIKFEIFWFVVINKTTILFILCTYLDTTTNWISWLTHFFTLNLSEFALCAVTSKKYENDYLRW